MISEKVSTTVADLQKTYWEVRRQNLDNDFKITVNEMVMQGLGRSGAAIEALRVLFRDALRDIAGNMLSLFSSALGLHAGMPKERDAEEVQRIIMLEIRERAKEFDEKLATAAKNAGVQRGANLSSEVSRLETEVKQRADLLVRAVAQRKKELRGPWYKRFGGQVIIGVAILAIGSQLPHLGDLISGLIAWLGEVVRGFLG